MLVRLPVLLQRLAYFLLMVRHIEQLFFLYSTQPNGLNGPEPDNDRNSNEQHGHYHYQDQ